MSVRRERSSATLEPVEEQGAVRQLGQRVVQRLAGQLHLRALALDGVANRSAERRRRHLDGEQVVLRADANGLDAELVVVVLGDHDDRRARGGHAQLLQRVQRPAAVAREVEQDARGAVIGAAPARRRLCSAPA